MGPFRHMLLSGPSHWLSHTDNYIVHNEKVDDNYIVHNEQADNSKAWALLGRTYFRVSQHGTKLNSLGVLITCGTFTRGKCNFPMRDGDADCDMDGIHKQHTNYALLHSTSANKVFTGRLHFLWAPSMGSENY